MDKKASLVDFERERMAYIKALGTPCTVGEKILSPVRGKYRKVVAFDWEPPFSLVAVLDDGSKVRDYEDLSNNERRVRIREFFKSNARKETVIKKGG